jgi:anti-sigma regulatory factor (Ser/Thr protein kinase)
VGVLTAHGTEGEVGVTVTNHTLSSPVVGLEGPYLRQDAFQLPSETMSVGKARGRIHARLHQWGVRQNVREDAKLVVSELFTNAVVHTDSSYVTCRMRTTTNGLLHLSVADQGRGLPSPRVPETGQTAYGGRGLILVNAVADRWGVDDDHGAGRIVWAVLPLTSCP